MDRLDDAWAMMERSVAVEPSWEGYSNLGTFYFAESRYADAVRMYEKTLEVDDTHYGTWGNLAAACRLTDAGGERAAEYYAKAAELAEAQLRLRPHDAALLTHLASYHTELGQTERARELVDRALALDPGNDKVMFQAGHTYEVLGDRDAALEWILKAVECGYSRAQVESTPALRELCTDERYRSLVRRGGEES
jgi:tetratricopeptide (TPR) repeat protein